MSTSDIVLDHIAVAVEKIDEIKKVYEDLGLTFAEKREEVPTEGVKTAFAEMNDHSHLELLEPLPGEGPIRKYLNKKGQGIHHLSFLVKNLAKKCHELKEKGYNLIYEVPVKGANDKLVNFIHPKSTGGVLIELSQVIEKR